MPCRDCRDENDDLPSQTELSTEVRRLEAMLCAVLSAYSSSELKGLMDHRIDWEETGVARQEVADWWRLHKVRDEKRRRRIRVKQCALSKLSAEEREALGLE